MENTIYGNVTPRCPLCLGTEFADMRGRVMEVCVKCKAKARTRSTYVLLTEFCKINKDSKIAHFAPEPVLSNRLHEICGSGYTPFDFANERYKEPQFGMPFEVKHCDMCKDLPDLPQAHFDVVIHNHVLEHVPCNYTIVLQQLHGLLKKGGVHLFSFPVRPGHFRENQAPSLTHEQRRKVFGQKDHLRRFGTADFEQMVGRIFGLGNDYSLDQLVSPQKLHEAAIPPDRWSLKLGPIFAVRKT